MDAGGPASLEENLTRLQFFQERLEYEADKGASVKRLQEHYANFLKGVFIEEPEETKPEDATQRAEASRGLKGSDDILKRIPSRLVVADRWLS